MNRLIIIGNGFDMAHKLPTKYCHFITDYWRSIKNSDYEDEFYKFFPGWVFKKYSNLNSVLQHYNDGKSALKWDQGTYRLRGEVRIQVQNLFFHDLNLRKDDVGWVDIEMEYYKALKTILQRNVVRSDDEHNKQSLQLVSELNKNVLSLKNRFELYLKDKVLPLLTIPEYNIPAMESLFENENCTSADVNRFYKEFPSKYLLKTLKPEFDAKLKIHSEAKLYEHTCILNFNYTNTFEMYLNRRDYKVINIHGQVDGDINLGFGDEKDEFYNDIENLNENEYLMFMKSFQYLKNNRYKQLSDFIESADYQVQILGHSCGLSDRTLLKAIFENVNCKSIKIHYHGEPSNNNHTHLVQNISRHFSDKVQMRSKIVDETLSRPLPQNSRMKYPDWCI